MNPAAVNYALRRLISDLDYDLHKSLEFDEETAEDCYPDLIEAFIDDYEMFTAVPR